MDEQKQTLAQVGAAIDAVEAARADKSITLAQKHLLESAVVKLRETEKTIIELQQQALVDILIQDAKALQTLSVAIAQSAQKLSNVACALANVSKVILTLINAVTAAMGTGLL